MAGGRDSGPALSGTARAPAGPCGHARRLTSPAPLQFPLSDGETPLGLSFAGVLRFAGNYTRLPHRSTGGGQDLKDGHLPQLGLANVPEDLEAGGRGGRSRTHTTDPNQAPARECFKLSTAFP